MYFVGFENHSSRGSLSLATVKPLKPLLYMMPPDLKNIFPKDLQRVIKLLRNQSRTSKQTNKQTSKQSSKQTNGFRNKKLEIIADWRPIQEAPNTLKDLLISTKHISNKGLKPQKQPESFLRKPYETNQQTIHQKDYQPPLRGFEPKPLLAKTSSFSSCWWKRIWPVDYWKMNCRPCSGDTTSMLLLGRDNALAL